MSHVEVLSRSIKKILFDYFTSNFAKDPAYSELRIVNRKSDLEVPAKGIFFRNVSYDKVQFSPDNYIGNIKAFSSLAKVGHYESAFVTFVQDDEANLYKLVTEDVSEQIAPNKFKFNTQFEIIKQDRFTRQPYPADSPEHIQVSVNGILATVTSVKGREKVFSIDRVPVQGDVVEVTYVKRNLAFPGYYFLQLDSTAENFYLGTFHAIDGLSISPKLDHIQINFPSGFLSANPIQIYLDGVEYNDGYTIVANGDFINFSKKPPGLSIQIKKKSDNTVLVSGTDWVFSKYKEEVLVNSAIGNEVYLQPSELKLSNIHLFINGKETTDFRYLYSRIVLNKPVKQGSQISINYIYKPNLNTGTVQVNTIFEDNTKFKLPDTNIYSEFFEAYKGFSRLPSDAYEVDFINGYVDFKDVVDSDYLIHYRVDKGTTGPFPITKDTWTNTLIPGVIIYFGNTFIPNDKTVILVGDQQKNCADEYGGKWRFSIELGVKTLSPEETEILTDKLVMFCWAQLKPMMDAMGLFFEDVQHSGESEEEISESTGDTDFQTSVSLVVYSDWWYRVPRKFRLMSLSSSLQPITERGVAEGGVYLPNFDSKEIYYLDTIERY